MMPDGAARANNNTFISAQSFAPVTDPTYCVRRSPVCWDGAGKKLLTLPARSGVAVPAQPTGSGAAASPSPSSPSPPRRWWAVSWFILIGMLLTPAPIAMATKSPNPCPRTLGSSLNQAAGQQLWSQCVPLTAGDSVYDAQVIFWPSLGPTVENVGIVGQMVG